MDSDERIRPAIPETKVDPVVEAELRGQLGQFTVALLKALMMSGIYPPEHPAIVNISSEPMDFLEKLSASDDVNEITFMAASSGLGDDITVEGVLAEGVPFTELVTSTMAEHFARKFVEYFDRNRLVSFSLKTRIQRDEFQRLISVFVERRTKEEEHGQKSALPFGDQLINAGIVHASAMTREEIVGGERPLPWRVKMAISRLRKDLRHVPLYSRATQSELAKAKTMLVQDITRPLRRPQFLKELLSNCDLITGGVEELAAVDMEREIIWCLHPGMLVNISWEVVADLDRAAWGEIMQSVGGKDRRIDALYKEILKKIALRLKEVDPSTTRDLLHYLFRKKALKYEDLPYSLQQQLLVEKWADQFLPSADSVVERFKGLNTTNTYHQYINTFLQIFPELVRRGCIEECASIAAAIREHLSEPSVAIPDRQQRAQVALARFTEPYVLDKLVSFADTEHKETRQAALSCLASLGERTLGALLRVLTNSEQAHVRREVAKTIEGMGEESHVPLMEMLSVQGQEWFVYRNIIMLLGNVNCIAAGDDILRFLSHPHPRVREEAILSAFKLQGEAAVREVMPLVRDRDKGVARRAISMLGGLKNKNPFFLQALLETVRIRKDDSRHPEELVLAALDAIRQVGTFEVDKADIRDALVERLESTKSKLDKLFRKKSRVVDSEALKGAICAVLGELGDVETARSMEFMLKDPSPLVRERAAAAIKRVAQRMRTPAG